MTTSNQPEAVAERVSALPRLPRAAGCPVFAEPWQAQAFALAVKLSEDGHFTWKEWAAALADELNAADDRGEPDDGTHYYKHWLAALERLVVDKGLTKRPRRPIDSERRQHSIRTFILEERYAFAKPSLDNLRARHRYSGAVRSTPRADGESSRGAAVPP